MVMTVVLTLVVEGIGLIIDGGRLTRLLKVTILNDMVTVAHISCIVLHLVERLLLGRIHLGEGLLRVRSTHIGLLHHHLPWVHFSASLV